MPRVSSAAQGLALPQLNAPFVDPTSGLVRDPWVRFLVNQFVKNGGNAGTIQSSVYLQSGTSGITAYQAGSASSLGIVQTIGQKGQPVELLADGTSPKVFLAVVQGTLVVDSGKIELSRDGETFYTIGLAGGAIPLLVGDSARITWFTAPPVLAFFPSYAEAS